MDADTKWPRGLSRDEAARYVGIGTTLFDAMVLDGRMPHPRTINSRVIWDRLELDDAFNELPHRGREPVKKVFALL